MICKSCRYAARLWRIGLCNVDQAPHKYGELVWDCEQYIRHELERGGGVGQLLVAVKTDHRQQEADRSLLYKVTELHGPHKCPGLTWCDCQHHVLAKSISP